MDRELNAKNNKATSPVLWVNNRFSYMGFRIHKQRDEFSKILRHIRAKNTPAAIVKDY